MSDHAEELNPLYGLMAEFETPGELVEAARRTQQAGYRKFDAYSPLPLHELDDAMDLHDNRVSLFTLIGCLGSGPARDLASQAGWKRRRCRSISAGGR